MLYAVILITIGVFMLSGILFTWDKDLEHDEEWAFIGISSLLIIGGLLTLFS